MQRFTEHTDCGTDECCGTCSSLIENNIFRVGSEKYFEYFREAREQYHAGNLEVDAADLDIIESNLGEFAQWRGEHVALDCIFEAEEKKPIGKPMRGGPKKYYVYVSCLLYTSPSPRDS